MKIPQMCPICQGAVISKDNGFFECENHYIDKICRGFAGNSDFIRIGHHGNTFVVNLDRGTISYWSDSSKDKLISNEIPKWDLSKENKKSLYEKIENLLLVM